MNKKILIGMVFVLGAVILYTYFFSQDTQPMVEEYPKVVEDTISETVVDDDMNTFTHPRYGFSLKYNDELDVQRIKEGNASETVVFSKIVDTELIKGFQVFITPYAEETITQERLQKDVPSGDVREQMEVIVGSGLRAMAFKSSISPIGETREVWFIHDGFIYEFTTPLNFDAWLSGILGTIEFNTE